MAESTEGQEPQKTPEEVIADLKAKVADLEPKAAASSQNFERLKKAEDKAKELETKLAEKGESTPFDPVMHEKRVDAKVDLRLAGWTAEMIAEAEAYAKGRGISLPEAAQSAFVKSAVDAMRAAAKSVETTPASSNRTVMFNGKPVEEVFKTGTPAEKQAAFEARLRGGVKSSE